MITLAEYLKTATAYDPRVGLYVGDRRKESHIRNREFLRRVGAIPGVTVSSVESLSEQTGKVLTYRSDHEPRKIPGEITKLFQCNCRQWSQERRRYLPAGRDFRGYEAFKAVYEPGPIEKVADVYLNFSLNTHTSRKRIFKYLKGADTITAKHGGDRLDYSISREEFAGDLRDHRFVICPPGQGLDTFRLWDSLCCGCVAVVRDGTVPEMPLPIIRVKDFRQWGVFRDPDYVSETWAKMLNTEYNFEMLTMDWWVEEITRTFNSVQE